MHQSVQLAAWKDVAQYCYLKRKWLEISGTLGRVTTMTTANAVAAIEEALKKRADGLEHREPDTRNT